MCGSDAADHSPLQITRRCHHPAPNTPATAPPPPHLLLLLALLLLPSLLPAVQIQVFRQLKVGLAPLGLHVPAVLRPAWGAWAWVGSGEGV